MVKELTRIGKKTPEARDDDVRELSMYTCRIICGVEGEDAEILTDIKKRRVVLPERIGKHDVPALA